MTAPMTTFLKGFVGTATNHGQVLQQFALRAQQPLALYSVGAYFQDEFRVTQKLKLTLALRADRNSGGICQSGCASQAVNPFNFLHHPSPVPSNPTVTVAPHL